MNFNKYSTEKLKKFQKKLLIAGLLGLMIMCFALGIGIYQMSQHDESILIYLVPTVFGPLAILPSVFSGMVGGEIKKREKADS